VPWRLSPNRQSWVTSIPRLAFVCGDDVGVTLVRNGVGPPIEAARPAAVHVTTTRAILARLRCEHDVLGPLLEQGALVVDGPLEVFERFIVAIDRPAPHGPPQ
jgi:hypothetical protein